MIRLLAVLSATMLTGCLLRGIPDADPSFKPVKHRECKVIVTDGHHGVCMTDEEFQRWRQRNGL